MNLPICNNFKKNGSKLNANSFGSERALKKCLILIAIVLLGDMWENLAMNLKYCINENCVSFRVSLFFVIKSNYERRGKN